MCHVMRKPGKTKAQISCAVVAAHLFLLLMDSIIINLLFFLNPKFQPNVAIISLTVQASLCQAWSETPDKGFIASRLICHNNEILPLVFSIQVRQNVRTKRLPFGGIFDLSRDARKPVFGVSDQVRHKPACTS